MKTKRVWIVVAAAAVLLLVVVFVVEHLVNADTYRGRIEAALSESLGRPVTLGELRASIISGSLVAKAPSIADDPRFSNQPFLAAKDIRIGVEMAPLLLHHELHITGLTIDQPKIVLLRAEDGTWNYSSLGGQKAKAPATDANNPLPNLTVGSIDIKDGTLTLGRLPSNGPGRLYTSLNVTAKNFSFVSSFPFTVSGKLPGVGTLTIRGTAGPIDAKDASLTPLTAQVSLQHADLVEAGLVQASQGIAGVADLDTKIVSNGQTAQADGTLNLTHLRLVKNGSASSQPVQAQFSVAQDLQAMTGRITSAALHIGNAALTLGGTYQTRGNVTSVQARVNGQDMPIDDLVAFLPSLGVQLPAGSRLQGGTLTLALDVSGPANALVISGPVRAANTQLAGFDLGRSLSSIAALTGAKTGSTTTIQTLSTNLNYGPAGVRTDNLEAVVTGMGSATGSGTISPAGALNYHLLVKLASGGVAGTAVSLLSGVLGTAVTQTAQNGIPLTIGGTTSHPTFTPDMSRMLGGTTQKKGPAVNPLSKALGGFFPK